MSSAKAPGTANSAALQPSRTKKSRRPCRAMAWPRMEGAFIMRESLFRDAIKIFVATQEQFLPRDGGRGVERFVELVGGEHFEFIRLFDDECHAVTADQVNPSVRTDWRGIHIVQIFEPFSVDQCIARLGVQAREHPVVAGEKVKFVAVEKR